jgi:predicted  nucleic acid-binding Zn-ribbon protein
LTKQLERLVEEYESLQHLCDGQKLDLENAGEKLRSAQEAYQNASKEVNKLSKSELELQSQLQKTRTDADLQS